MLIIIESAYVVYITLSFAIYNIVRRSKCAFTVIPIIGMSLYLIPIISATISVYRHSAMCDEKSIVVGTASVINACVQVFTEQSVTIKEVKI